MKGTRKLTPRGAIWAGLLATPVLVVAVVAAIGVAVAPAGPSTAAAPAATVASTEVVTHAVQQTVAQVEAYWTPARMAAAEPYPLSTSAARTIEKGTLIPMAEPTSPAIGLAGGLPGGTALPQAGVPATSQSPQHEPYGAAIPYTRWSLIGRYNKYPNSTVAKMFFTQDPDGTGPSGPGNFVCSASSMGPDEVWTAGHCASNNAGITQPGVPANGFSYNILVCPSYDNAPLPGVGCWGATDIVALAAYKSGGGGNVDMAAIDTTDTGDTVGSQIGVHTGWLGFLVNAPRNQHWVAMGYPAASPFAGGKLILSAGSYGYDDNWPADAVLSVTMGNNMTGGSSGGPWIVNYGLPGQVGGPAAAVQNMINGHNDWKYVGFPNEMMSPYLDCRAMAIYNFIRGTSIACP
ncbi:hypothetical protein BH20ACT13_BH20ACT13_23990 [soil metagenome]